MKPSCIFYSRTDRKNKLDEIPVYLRITYNRKIRYVSTGINIEEKYWNSKKEKVRKSHPSSKLFNEELTVMKLKAQQIGIELSLTFHISRHSFARHAANMGMNVYAISNALAHSNLKTTQTYLSSFDESLLDREMQSLF